jgi:glycosylphosphatidylinositol deacylase
MAVIGPLVIFSGFIFVIFMLGLHNFLISNEENGCEMTYMIEYPQFVVSFGNLCQLILQYR